MMGAAGVWMGDGSTCRDVARPAPNPGHSSMAVLLELGHLSSSSQCRASGPLTSLHIGQHLSPELSLLLPCKQYSCMFRITSSLAVLQLARNIGNAGFNDIMEASLSSFSLKPVAHSDM